MRTALDEDVQPGDVVCVAKPRGDSGYALIRRTFKRTALVSYLAPPNGDAWLPNEVALAEDNLLFKLSNPEIKELRLP
jgi:hypothetical protein